MTLFEPQKHLNNKAFNHRKERLKDHETENAKRTAEKPRASLPRTDQGTESDSSSEDRHPGNVERTGRYNATVDKETESKREKGKSKVDVRRKVVKTTTTI